jgi:SAM-dependent methyltransferase
VDRAELSAVCHAGLPFANPLSEEKVDELVGSLALGAGARVLDVGAGNGEILRRIVARYGVRGLGLDPAAAAPSVDERAELRRARIEELTERDFDVVVNVAASHAFGRWHDALAGLAGLVRPGGLVLFGEGYWRRDPPAAYLEALGATADELPYGLGDLVRGAEAHGLRSVHLAVAGEDDWDRYEWRLIRNGERAAAQLGDDPDARALRAWTGAARDRVLGEGGRDTLGFALVLFTRE